MAGEINPKDPVIQEIIPSLKETPFKIQSATNRQWERAWKMSLDDFSFTEDQVRHFIKGKIQIVAIELFYKTIKGLDFYLGVQYHPDLKGPQDPFEFMTTYFQTLLELKDRSFQNMAQHLGKVLNHDPSTFSFAEPTSVLLGVVDWWMTFGPCEIWRRGEPRSLSLRALRQKLKGHENLTSNTKNYTGLEFVYDLVPKYWVSFQVGERDKDMFHLDYDRTLKLLSEYLNFTV
jgi:hypothetical protein